MPLLRRPDSPDSDPCSSVSGVGWDDNSEITHVGPARYLASDLVNRDFARTEPNRLWLTDITEHRTREGKVYCAVVLDAFTRRVAGWSIDSSQTASLVVNALGMKRPGIGECSIS